MKTRIFQKIDKKFIGFKIFENMQNYYEDCCEVIFGMLEINSKFNGS